MPSYRLLELALWKLKTLCLLGILLCAMFRSNAQEAYEIQVYGSQTMQKGNTIFELHSNVSPQASTKNPDIHPLHETIEITHGFNDFFEIGFYVFTREENGKYQWMGDHIRPRVMAPQKWNWPVGVSLSAEFGYVQEPYFSQGIWDMEIRPIIDKTFFNKLYLSLNPTLEKAVSGNEDMSYQFSPNLKASYQLSQRIGAGIEYYGAMGPLQHFNYYQQQQHQLYGVIDLYFSPQWEFNFGLGYGLTETSDRLNAKLILGRRFGK